MLKCSLENTQYENQALLDEFKHQGDVKMYIQFPDYDDIRGFELPNEMDVSELSGRIFAEFTITSLITLNRHIYNMRVRKKLFKAIRENTLNDKKDESGQGGFFQRSANIPISGTFNDLAEMDFVDYGVGGTFLYMRYTFSRYPMITFIGNKKRRGNRLIK